MNVEKTCFLRMMKSNRNKIMIEVLERNAKKQTTLDLIKNSDPLLEPIGESIPFFKYWSPLDKFLLAVAKWSEKNQNYYELMDVCAEIDESILHRDFYFVSQRLGWAFSVRAYNAFLQISISLMLGEIW